jgi:hypothetical protein
MNEAGKFLVLAGLLLVLIGALLWSGFDKGWFGRLPGDIHYSKGDFHFYFPIVTCGCLKGKPAISLTAHFGLVSMN